MINQSKPTTSYTNTAKINIGEVWNTDLNQWQNESRTWDDMASLLDNATKISSSISNIAKP
jgi:hypothetical protein